MSKSKPPTAYTGVSSKNPPLVVFSKRDPTSNDTSYTRSTIWINEDLKTAFIFTGEWVEVGGGGGGGDATFENLTVNQNALIQGSLQALNGGELTVDQFHLNSGGTAEFFGDLNISKEINLNTNESNLIFGNGSSLTMTSGINNQIGSAFLSSGSVVIPMSNIKTGDWVFVQRSDYLSSTALGDLVYQIVENDSITISSIRSDGNVETGDNSSVNYLIIRSV